MGEVWQWVVTHGDDLLRISAYAIAIASVVVRITPTLKDDHALKGFIQLVGKYVALNKYGPSPVDQDKANAEG